MKIKYKIKENIPLSEKNIVKGLKFVLKPVFTIQEREAWGYLNLMSEDIPKLSKISIVCKNDNVTDYSGIKCAYVDIKPKLRGMSELLIPINCLKLYK